MTIYNDLNELIEEYIRDSYYLTNEEISQIRECNMVIEDIVSGEYEEMDDGSIKVY